MPRITRRQFLAGALAVPPLVLTCGQPAEVRVEPPASAPAALGARPPVVPLRESGAAEAPSPRETLDLWHFAWDDPLERRLWSSVTRELEQELPHVRLNQEFYRRPLEEVVFISAAAGMPPDAASIQDVFFPHWVERNLYVNLQTFVNAWSDETALGGIPAAGLGAFRYYPEAGRAGLGDFYGLPWRSNPRLLFINETMLRESGLSSLVSEERWTLETAREAGSRLAKSGADNRPNWGVVGFPDSWFQAVPWLWSGGGDVLDEAGRTSTLAAPDAAGALSVLQDWRHALRIAPQVGELGADAYVEHFAHNRLAMYLGSARDVFRLQETETAWQARALYTVGGNDSRVLTHYDGMAVVTGAQHVDGAWEFLSWLLGPVAQGRALADGQALPVRSDALTASTAAPHYAETVRDHANSQRRLPIAPSFALYSPVIAHHYHRMMNGGLVPVPETLAKLHAILNFILQRGTLPNQWQ